MKYIVMLGDGMADLPIAALNKKTPLEAANKPAMDYLAAHGINGMVDTVPEGMVPESDTANLSVMGYNPEIYSKGRSPLEAASMGIIMQDDETAIRANIVALGGEGEYEDLVMLDHSSDEIPTEQARVLIDAVQEKFGNDIMKFHCGISYRHCLIWKNCPEFNDFSRPHDIIGRRIGDYLPKSDASRPMYQLMKESYDFLNNHPLNIEREKQGLKKANSLWLWSPGKKPALPNFAEMTGLKGTVVCAVDLIKGIGVCAGMEVPFVEGATGALNTNYSGKRQAAIEALENGSDFVYIHVEAPDECGHQGRADEKIQAIENIDKYILSPLVDYLRNKGEAFKILLMPDHPTPVSARTHTRAPVPFVIYSSENEIQSGISAYSEKGGESTGLYLDRGEKLIEMLVGDKK
ncbi:MAG: cofactor-independent phosphoglycerate mutase [Ruminococcaceae bacterium]|nr:cofactor-independent phosphoglycerate mutase [Oscillospiraceae bacterium]